MKSRQHDVHQSLPLISTPLAVDFIRFEKNLLQMGFFGAHDTRHRSLSTRRIEQLVNREGQKIKVAAEFRASQEFGLPSTSDRDKYIAFMRIAMEQKAKAGGALQNPIRFTGYQLLKELGLSFSGENYEDINRWGQRMADTSITSEQVIYLAAKKKYANKTVHVFRSFTRAGQSNLNGSGKTEAFEVVLEDWLLENLNQSYVVPEDFNAYRKLKRPTAKGVFGYLHLWFHASQGRAVEKDYGELCVLLNIPAYRHLSKIRETMGRSLDELTSIGYLSKWDVKPMITKSGYKLMLSPGEEVLRVLAITQRKQLSGTRQPEILAPTEAQRATVEVLVSRGVSRAKAAMLSQTTSPQSIQEQIEYWESLLKQGGRKKIKSPAGFLIYLIENQISPPSESGDSTGRKSAGKSELHPLRPSDTQTHEQQYEDFVVQKVDEELKARYPGRELAKRVKAIVKESILHDEVFDSFHPAQQGVLAEQILRQEIRRELVIPTFDEWRRQREQFPLF
ncbi:MAG: replication initiator protein A [Acidobacteriaceae bacterium]|nr:replication initiator protein A [Acidobacteriaceae bacterium]